MAAEAQQNATDFLRARGNGGRQYFDVPAAVTKRDRLTVEWAGVLTPQCVAAGIGRAAVAGTEGPAMRRVATSATATLVVMRAEDVDRGRPVLAQRQAGAG